MPIIDRTLFKIFFSNAVSLRYKFRQNFCFREKCRIFFIIFGSFSNGISSILRNSKKLLCPLSYRKVRKYMLFVKTGVLFLVEKMSTNIKNRQTSFEINTFSPSFRILKENSFHFHKKYENFSIIIMCREKIFIVNL